MDKCPKCGANRNDREDTLELYSCGSYRTDHFHGPMKYESVTRLRNQLAAAKEREAESRKRVEELELDKLILTSALSRLVGYAETCKSENTKEWMVGLENKINSANVALKDGDRVHAVNFDGEWSFLLTPKE